MKTYKLFTTLAVSSALALQVSFRAWGYQSGGGTVENCWADGGNKVCEPAGTIIDEWEDPCEVQTAEGPVNSWGMAYETTDNPAYKATVQEVAPPNLFGTVGIFNTMTITPVDTTISYPDPNDCSNTLEEPGDGDFISCAGETPDWMTELCW